MGFAKIPKIYAAILSKICNRFDAITAFQKRP